MVLSSATRPAPLPEPGFDQKKPIDMVHLNKQALGDWGLECELLRMFDQMSRTYYERIETSTNVPDLLRNLHTLKGAAAGIGAFGIAELARVIEIELREGAPVNPERIDDLNMAVEEASAFIGALLANEEALLARA